MLSNNKLKVLKFGGTSVGSAPAIESVFNIVSKSDEYRKIVVVSAQKGITDLLLHSFEDKLVLKEIDQRLKDLAEALSVDHEIFTRSLDELKQDLSKEIEKREKMDLIASYGERISANIVSQYFNQNDLPAYPVDARDFIRTNSHFTDARYDPKKTYSKIKDFFAPLMEKEKWEIPVITGFIGQDDQGRTTTLGRGGSDLTATLIGSALNVEIIEIWSDADGILSADPKVVEDSVLLEKLSYEEAIELSNFGAKIMYSKALRPTLQTKTPVQILNTFNPSSKGTLITEKNETRSFSITSKSNTSIVTIFNPDMIEAVGYLASLFDIFREMRLSIDVVAVSEASVSVSLSNLTSDESTSLKEKLGSMGKTEIKNGCAIVSVISRYLDEKQDVLSEIFKVLSSQNIDIEMISYGNKEINLTLIVQEKKREESIRSLHKLFLENFHPKKYE